MDEIGQMRKQRHFTEAEIKLRQAEFEYRSERSSQFYTDPDKANVRRRAKKVIAQRLGEVLSPDGFEPAELGTGWVFELRGVRRSVGVQPGKAGARCYINVGRVPNRLATMRGQKRTVVRLSRFCDDCILDELDPLHYFDVEERPEILDKAVEVMSTNVVPWLLK